MWRGERGQCFSLVVKVFHRGPPIHMLLTDHFTYLMTLPIRPFPPHSLLRSSKQPSIGAVVRPNSLVMGRSRQSVSGDAQLQQ